MVRRSVRTESGGNVVARALRACNLYTDFRAFRKFHTFLILAGRMQEAAVARYLDAHPEFLARYVAERVRVDALERWLIRKMKTDTHSRKTSLSRWKFCVHADKRKMLQDIMDSLKEQPTVEKVVWELGQCVSSAVCVDGCEVLEISRSDPQNITVYLPGEVEGEIETVVIAASKRPAAVQAAMRGQPLRLSRSEHGHRYPEGICSNAEAEYALYQPLVKPDGDTAMVLEMWRLSEPFEEEDEEISASYLVWGGMALHYAQLYLNMDKQKDLADFLLTVVKSIFQDMVSMEVVVTKVMNFAQKLVHADRASLFLVDSKTRELYATVFDVGVDPDTHSGSGSEASASKSAVTEIRFPVGTGIAGHVAETGEVLNIMDAYDDERFNRTVDSLTGYKTKTILCMPIYIRNAIIGVVQMVNKKSGPFTKVDEKSFEMFAVYCGLALHHAKLYDKIKRSQQKYKVALEVLSYHNTCTEEEVKIALEDVTPSQNVGLDDFFFSPFSSGEFEKASHTIFMFQDLFGLKLFDRSLVVKFVLTVRKNYRRVPYHNWTHGFSVANCMYNILKNSESFSLNEQLALFIGALCHDLDHRGKNNKFMLDTASPLAAMYSTSTMEHHHFNQTVTILQQEGHNIFAKLSNSEYKRVLGLVKQCILATDLALFFPNRTKLEQLVRDNQFSWTKSDHRALVLAISMTASDLSASAKPWDIQVETVRVIFQEFYEQGDAERAAGRRPIPMMDRTRPEEQAASQVGFLSGICVPCYSLLAGLLPSTRPLLDMCRRNLERWQRIERDVAAELSENRTVPSHLYVDTQP